MNSTTKYSILAIVLLVVLVGAYFLQNSQSTPAVETTEAKTKSFSLVVEGRKIVSGETTLVVQKGDVVSITITADESDELHVHAYDESVDFEAGVPATVTFTATQSGRFPFEMEGSKTDLGELEVQP